MTDLDEKLDEILDDLGESYHPEHEYNTAWQGENEELRAEKAKAIKQAFKDAGYAIVTKTPHRDVERREYTQFTINYPDGSGEFVRQPVDKEKLDQLIQDVMNMQVNMKQDLIRLGMSASYPREVNAYVGPDSVLPVPTPRTPEELQAIQEELNKPRMTGQDWYARFEKEYAIISNKLSSYEERQVFPSIASDLDYAKDEVLAAAKRASGIE